jgi:hypothetical protein
VGEVECCVRPNLEEVDQDLEVGVEGSEWAVEALGSEELGCLHVVVEGHVERDSLHRILAGSPAVAVVGTHSVHAGPSAYLVLDHLFAAVVGPVAVEAAFSALSAQILKVQVPHEHFARVP